VRACLIKLQIVSLWRIGIQTARQETIRPIEYTTLKNVVLKKSSILYSLIERSWKVRRREGTIFAVLLTETPCIAPNPAMSNPHGPFLRFQASDIDGVSCRPQTKHLSTSEPRACVAIEQAIINQARTSYSYHELVTKPQLLVHPSSLLSQVDAPGSFVWAE
jgi:hypothetical protein